MTVKIDPETQEGHRMIVFNIYCISMFLWQARNAMRSWVDSGSDFIETQRKMRLKAGMGHLSGWPDV
jgi:hypothetical protein